MKRPLIFLLLLLSIPLLLPAQEETPVERADVFAPFASRLRVAVRDPQVRLTWRDAADVENATYEIYRSTVEIDSESLFDAELIASVETGIETYLDTPLEAGSYYYAVLVRSESDELYRIFVPFRNVTIRPVAVEQLETVEDLAASVYDIEARIQNESVIIRFDASRSGRQLAIYRSTVPFSTETDLANVTRIEEFESSTRRIVDFPVPGVGYYYAVFDTELVQNGSQTVEIGENATAEPIEIPLFGAGRIRVEVPAANARPTPLPFLQLATGLRPGGTIVPGATSASVAARPVSLATEEAIASLLAYAPPRESFSPEPVVLPAERAGDQQGAARTLAQVVMQDFAEGKYVDSVDLLQNVLRLPLNEDVEMRVRFYLGQALYFSGETEAAFLEFLLVSRSGMYEEGIPWINGILTG